MKNTVRIYTLSDPRTNAVRYVGRTVNPLSRRVYEHIRVAIKGKLKDKTKEVWINELIALGLKPVIAEIEVTGLDDFQAAEKRWVAHYRATCNDLLNIKCGGDGALGGHFVAWTPEMKAMLGVVADSKVARLMGITRKAVSYWRDQFGVAASFDRSDNTAPPPMGGHNKMALSADVVARFGKEPDYKIAGELGVQKSIIARRRRAMGIASYAATTGSSGVFVSGMPHPRWSKRIAA